MRTSGKLLLCLVLQLAIGTGAFAESEEAIRQARSISLAFEKVAETITPAVVNIRAVTKIRTASRQPRHPLFNDPFFAPFRDFFGDDFGGQGSPFQPPEGYSQEGMGSGVLIDSKGHIITNNHVIGKADEVKVRLADNRELPARVVGVDPRSDLAVIRIEADKLTYAPLGDSDSLKIGEWVVAVGNPFGLNNTITAGIISAKGRSLADPDVKNAKYQDFIQTDAAINPGNSGGPLVNLSGEIVGINTAILSQSGGYMGIGFAIPSNMVKSVTDSLISTGKVVRGWLGVAIQPLTEDLAQSFNFAGTEGILIGSVDESGPAAKAGLQQGDIVVALNGRKMSEINGFRNAIAATKPGSKVSLDIVRDGRKKEVDVRVGELPSSSERPRSADDQDANASDVGQKLGLQVQEITPQIARRLGVKTGTGVVVSAVSPASAAMRAGIQQRDIILSVNGMRIESLEDYENALSKADLKKGLRLVVESDGMEHFVFLKDPA